MKFLTTLPIFVLALVSNQCDSAKIDTVQLTTIAQGNLYGNGAEGISKQNLYITDADTWNALKVQMNSVNPVTDSFTETDIDFSKHNVIASFDEVKPSGGHAVNITVLDEKTSIVVTVKSSAPQGMATTVMTQPFHIVKIPKTDKEVVFNRAN